jgi:hypothetical protein
LRWWIIGLEGLAEPGPQRISALVGAQLMRLVEDHLKVVGPMQDDL